MARRRGLQVEHPHPSAPDWQLEGLLVCAPGRTVTSCCLVRLGGSGAAGNAVAPCRSQPTGANTALRANGSHFYTFIYISWV